MNSLAVRSNAIRAATAVMRLSVGGLLAGKFHAEAHQSVLRKRYSVVCR